MSAMNEQRRGTLEMVAAMTISGTIGWMVLASQRPVTEVVFWRCLLGALSLWPVCQGMGYLKRPVLRAILGPRQLLLVLGVGVAIVVNWLLLFAAYSRTSISVATVVYNTQPFMLVGLGMLFLGDRPGLKRLGWLLLSFAGVVLIVQGKPAGADEGAYLQGIALALGAAFFYAVAALFTKMLKGDAARNQGATGVPPQLISLIQTLVGTVLLLPFALRAEPIAAASWPWLVIMGVVHTGLMYILLYGAIQRLPTHMTATLSFLYPLVALLVDIQVFGVIPDKLQWLGGAAILLGAAGMVLGSNRPAHTSMQRGQGVQCAPK